MMKPDLITKKELDDFLKMQKRIIKLVKIKTVELSMIIYGREPKGEILDFDIKESYYEPECIYIRYNSFSHSNLYSDQYELPFKFLYDESYPVKYKKIHEEKKRKLKEERDKNGDSNNNWK